MRSAFSRAVRIYLYASAIFSVVYWIYLIIDDYVFIEKYWPENWQEYLIAWGVYFLMYFTVFSVYFWIVAVLGIIVYLHLFKPIVRGKRTS